MQCQRCRLVFVPRPYHLSAALEKAEYDKHRNTIDDAGYRKFLNRLAQPLIARLPAHSRGLDFGCGPGPALAEMLRSAGFEIVRTGYVWQTFENISGRQPGWLRGASGALRALAGGLERTPLLRAFGASQALVVRRPPLS